MNLPFLVTQLGRHEVILGKRWLAENQVLPDCHRRRLIWPEERSLQEELDADRRDELMDNSKPLNAHLEISKKPEPEVRIMHGRSYKKSHEASMIRMKKAFHQANQDQLESATTVPPPLPKRDWRENAKKAAKLDIALIGAVGFARHARQPKAELCMTSLYEIDKRLDELNHPYELEEPEIEEIKKQLPRQYWEFVDVFQKSKSDELPPPKPYDHKIELVKEQELGYSPIYRLGREELEAAKEYIIDNLNKGFIVASQAPFASPILMAKKLGGGLRFCVDYRKLNSITKKDRYPLPRVYSRSLISDKDFTGSECIRTQRISQPFGAVTGPLSLQAAIHKCEFHVTTTKYLGFIVTPEGIKVDPSKIDAVVKWTMPTTVYRVQSFLGFCNFYRKFIEAYSQVAAPLYRLTRLDTPFVWSKTCQEAFDRLKALLVSAPVLAHYRPERPTRVETDASDGVVAGVLSQLQEDKEWHSVAYFSHTITPAELNYNIHDKEMLAIIKALDEWRPELVGLQREDRFEILSNHKALEYFMTTKKLNAWQARWCEFLHDYYFILKYRPGRVNVLVDTLTRREGAEQEKNLDHRHQTLLPLDVLDPQIAQELGLSEVAKIHTSVNIMSRVVWANYEAAKEESYLALLSKNNGWSVSEGRLLYKDRLFVPDIDDLRARLLDEVHRQSLTAHPGRSKTKLLVKERFYWETWSSDIDRYVDNCMTCKRTNTRRDLPPGLLQPLPVPARPWQHISMDFMTYESTACYSAV
ncbi:retrotransposon polyprotein, putative [Talaromyces stipitatus ATCC 10500]|uniref:Retrotransposon polyprotein, putative n=1 Tax=Talaromyces stipitatus (strain ATCC 10500 / CBS 375.48 / QM 6759 / NRRL 1006) TaxID=441959 RepID=B8MI88_TALSN|nr:retrotransposon polyprotein, putative [Talaromyces stipitatus ATCC 10500]EED14572.1 retrotransposon polyprotein, putative [Talaromyces stipitatus ATCC 10500]